MLVRDLLPVGLIPGALPVRDLLPVGLTVGALLVRALVHVAVARIGVGAVACLVLHGGQAVIAAIRVGAMLTGVGLAAGGGR